GGGRRFVRPVGQGRASGAPLISNSTRPVGPLYLSASSPLAALLVDDLAALAGAQGAPGVDPDVLPSHSDSWFAADGSSGSGRRGPSWTDQPPSGSTGDASSIPRSSHDRSPLPTSRRSEAQPR